MSVRLDPFLAITVGSRGSMYCVSCGVSITSKRIVSHDTAIKPRKYAPMIRVARKIRQGRSNSGFLHRWNIRDRPGLPSLYSSHRSTLAVLPQELQPVPGP